MVGGIAQWEQLQHTQHLCSSCSVQTGSSGTLLGDGTQRLACPGCVRLKVAVERQSACIQAGEAQGVCCGDDADHLIGSLTLNISSPDRTCIIGNRLAADAVNKQPLHREEGMAGWRGGGRRTAETTWLSQPCNACCLQGGRHCLQAARPRWSCCLNLATDPGCVDVLCLMMCCAMLRLAMQTSLQC